MRIFNGRRSSMRLENDQPFVQMSHPTVQGPTLELPAALEGRYGVVVFYRGHW
jgi:hypothetical protein